MQAHMLIDNNKQQLIEDYFEHFLKFGNYFKENSTTDFVQILYISAFGCWLLVYKRRSSQNNYFKRK